MNRYDQIMQIQAVIFDRDLTLLYFDPAQLAAVEEQMAAIAPELPQHAAVRAWTSWPGPWPQHRDDEPAFWADFWASLGHTHGLQPAQIVRLTVEVGAIYHTTFGAYPDAAPTVRSLRSGGLRLAILTNYELPSVDRTLANAGIDPAQFDVALTSAMLGVYKPDRRAFLATAEALNLPPSACLFVDDLAENVAAARSVGMLAYQIDRSLPVDDLDAARLSTLDSLIGLLLPPFTRD
ncbi:HAD-IA family hydrolase [Oscillochloris sp. ZM17-4]|uniref:HAD family hydrolase n=1 Tax=Oscillochloris sp. ZM17-4 TaxID=2866714 RepID=UPI001C72F8FE|nr:HAD-IA family hydrolase [Oscillochloris sp. ZM17-4]MBX0327310.1 HAD-IA family hydrolase [Oscillochloris sp. ZM17-4]